MILGGRGGAGLPEEARGPEWWPVGPRSQHRPALGLLSLHPAFGVSSRAGLVSTPVGRLNTEEPDLKDTQGNSQFMALRTQAGKLDPAEKPGNAACFAVKSRGWESC